MSTSLNVIHWLQIGLYDKVYSLRVASNFPKMMFQVLFQVGSRPIYKKYEICSIGCKDMITRGLQIASGGHFGVFPK